MHSIVKCYATRMKFSVMVLLMIFRNSVIYLMIFVSKHVLKIFRKAKICYPLKRTHTYTYQEVRKINFLENFACVLNGWSLMFLTFPLSLLVFQSPAFSHLFNTKFEDFCFQKRIEDLAKHWRCGASSEISRRLFFVNHFNKT